MGKTRSLTPRGWQMLRQNYYLRVTLIITLHLKPKHHWLWLLSEVNCTGRGLCSCYTEKLNAGAWPRPLPMVVCKPPPLRGQRDRNERPRQRAGPWAGLLLQLPAKEETEPWGCGTGHLPPCTLPVGSSCDAGGATPAMGPSGQQDE